MRSFGRPNREKAEAIARCTRTHTSDKPLRGEKGARRPCNRHPWGEKGCGIALPRPRLRVLGSYMVVGRPDWPLCALVQGEKESAGACGGAASSQETAPPAVPATPAGTFGDGYGASLDLVATLPPQNSLRP